MEKSHKIKEHLKKIHTKVTPYTHHTKHLIEKGKKHAKKVPFIAWMYGTAGILILLITIVVVWGVVLRIPNIEDFDSRKVLQSIDLYDRNEVKLYSTGTDVTRIVVESEAISPKIKQAVIAAEDSSFYTHHGVVIKSTARAVFLTLLKKAGLRSGSIQGGSTITQQMIKNSLLNQDRTVVRKIKEWILAFKIEKKYTKEQILTIYLNDQPFGGKLYGVRAGSEAFFGKEPIDVTLAEAAYLAAIPNAPSYLSPYGKHVDALEARKNYVLTRMLDLGMITAEEFASASAEKVVFKDLGDRSSHAIHFVEYVMSTLSDVIDESLIEKGGLKIYTTLDLELQDKAEKIIRDHALQSEKDWNASNSALVAMDPKTGDIISMVGSRGYTDPNIDGKFNVALAKRQPGSSFKPFIYATAFEQGYTADTAIFDTKTQFGTDCPVASQSDASPCYSPSNYDGEYKGPIKLRDALAQSRNIPAVKLFYMVGIQNALSKTKAMGIRSLGDANQYGLTLVLGGGEVTLLDMVSAYGTFANDGTHVPPRAITRIEDEKGTVIATVESHGEAVLDPEAARQLNDVLSDNAARTPLFGANSGLYFAGRPVAAKSGTTNNNKDAWLLGYTPNLVVGIWSGNNDNTPMKKGSAINIKPWRQYMDASFEVFAYSPFIPPAPQPTDLKPILRGIWQGGETFKIDTVSGGLATEFTPIETTMEIAIPDPHDILHWVKRSDPRGAYPQPPTSDLQYPRFEYGAQAWINSHGGVPSVSKPNFDDNVHTQSNRPHIENFECNFDAQANQVECSAKVEHSKQLQGYSVSVNNVKALSVTSADDTILAMIPIYDFIEQGTPSVSVSLTVTDVAYSTDTQSKEVSL